MSIVAESVKLNTIRNPRYATSCNSKICNRHYTISIENTKCCCGSLFYTLYTVKYLYCVHDKKLYVYDSFAESWHSKCQDPAIIDACNRYIINKQWIAYCKLWYLIDVHITHDIARHIMLLKLQDKIIKPYRS
jgi:hypothetical protein